MSDEDSMQEEDLINKARCLNMEVVGHTKLRKKEVQGRRRPTHMVGDAADYEQIVDYERTIKDMGQQAGEGEEGDVEGVKGQQTVQEEGEAQKGK